MKQELKKRLIFYPCLFISIGVSAYLWWPGPVQWRNMRQARREIDSVKKKLERDTRFSQLTIGVGTVNLGRDILVRGSVPTQSSVDYLKSLMEQRISPKFSVRYVVQVEDSNKSVQSSEEKTEEAKPILSEKEMRIGKVISEYFGLGFSVEVRGPMTIEEVEKESLDELSKSSRQDIPKLPFGFMNDSWNEFKDKYQDGDEIYFFTSDKRSWRALYGRGGYVIIREDQIIDIIVTSLS